MRETTGSMEALGTPSWRRIALLALLSLALVVIIGAVIAVVS